MSKPKHAGGRPTAYQPAISEHIADAMATGLSLEAAAASCGVGPRTAFTWQNQHDEFRQSVEDGRARSLLFWERRAIALASGEAGNAAVVTLGLKNRSRAASGWHDAQRLEHSGPNGGPIQQRVTADINLKVLTDDELALFEELLVKTLPHIESQM